VVRGASGDDEGNSLGQGYNRPTGCSAEKAPQATFIIIIIIIIIKDPVYCKLTFQNKDPNCR